jgi:hypothetical protein
MSRALGGHRRFCSRSSKGRLGHLKDPLDKDSKGSRPEDEGNMRGEKEPTCSEEKV